MRIRTPRYADVVATAALLVAVSGGAYAASQLPKDSVTSRQVEDHSLKARDFKAGPAGPAGPNLLAVGAKVTEFGSLPTGCPELSVSSAPITVTRRAVVDVDGQAGFQAQGLASNSSHITEVRAQLLDQDGFVVAEAISGSQAGNDVTLQAFGLMTDPNGAPYVLRPGSPHTVQLHVVVISGQGCQGTSLVVNPRFDWMVHPAP